MKPTYTCIGCTEVLERNLTDHHDKDKRPRNLWYNRQHADSAEFWRSTDNRKADERESRRSSSVISAKGRGRGILGARARRGQERDPIANTLRSVHVVLTVLIEITIYDRTPVSLDAIEQTGVIIRVYSKWTVC